MNYRFRFLIFFCFLALKGATQNLVQDPGFELTKTDYWEISSELQENIVHWRSPTMTSPDILMQADSFQQISIYNYTPRNGRGVGGIFTYTHPTDTKITNNQFAYREYLRCPLTQSLEKGKIYYIEFWISILDDWSEISNNIGIAFSKKMIFTLSHKPLFIPPSVNLDELPNLSSGKWTKVSGTFTAKDDYAFLMIGNFHKNEKIKLKSLNNSDGKKGSYYLIDDVLVREKNAADQVSTSTRINNIIELKKDFQIVDSNIILNEVNFEYNSSIISSNSYAQLDKLFNIINTNQTLRIKIKGHTDNSGVASFNIELSSKRAEAVYDLLISKGISPNRLSFKGYGSKLPIADNTTKNGRAKNRRVEFKIEYQ